MRNSDCRLRSADWGLRNGRAARYAVGGRTAGHQRLGISHEQPQWPNKAISHLSRRPTIRRGRNAEFGLQIAECGLEGSLRTPSARHGSTSSPRANHEPRSTAQAHRRRVTNHGPRTTNHEPRITRWLRWAVGGSDRGSAGAARASSSRGTHGPCHRRRRCRGGFGNRAAC